MFRFSSRALVRATSALLQGHHAQEGFTFMESKALDKDIGAPYENMETLRLTLTRQDEFLLKEEKVKCVTVNGTNGGYGIYPGHSYKFARLVPAPLVVELPDGTLKKYFTSGGFAHINNEGSCDINTVECIPMEELDVAAAEKALTTAQHDVTQAKDEKAKAVAEVRVSVLEAVIQAIKH